MVMFAKNVLKSKKKTYKIIKHYSKPLKMVMFAD